MTKFMSTVLVYFVKPRPLAPPTLPIPTSPATEPTTIVATLPSSVTESDLEYEEDRDFSRIVEIDTPNITIEIVVEDCLQEDKDTNEEEESDSRSLMSI